MKMHYARNLYGYKLNNLCFIHEIVDNFYFITNNQDRRNARTLIIGNCNKLKI